MSNNKKILYADMLHEKKKTLEIFSLNQTNISCEPLSDRKYSYSKETMVQCHCRTENTAMPKKQWFNGVIGVENDSVCYVQVQQ